MGIYEDIILEVLIKSEIPLSEKEIWDYSIKENISEKYKIEGKTPWKTIGSKIYVSLRDDSNSPYIKIGKRPVRFTLKSLLANSDESQLLEKIPYEIKETKQNFSERDLHSLVVKFLNEDIHFKSYSKTIFHEKSNKSKKGKNEWLHPDIVSVYFPFKDFNNLTTTVQAALSENSLKIYSFELKISISFSTLRQYYFQAVSNSSWANEGYLVALNIDDDTELLDEIRRLNSAFGIGLIILNPDELSQSEIVFPAKENSNIDWNTVDRLINENKDFESFFQDLTEDLQISNVKSDYDQVFTDEEMSKYINQKGINK